MKTKENKAKKPAMPAEAQANTAPETKPALPIATKAQTANSEIVHIPAGMTSPMEDNVVAESETMLPDIQQGMQDDDRLYSLTPETCKKILEDADLKLQLIDGFKKIAIKRTNYRDWVLRGAKPSLCSPGAEKIKPIFGVYFKDRMVEKVAIQGDEAGNYQYLVTGTAGAKHFGEIPIEGSCSSRDSFFCKTRDEQGNSKLFKINEVDEMFVRRAAVSNFEVNAITRLLGLRSITIEELSDAGINMEKIESIEYRSAKQKEDANGQPVKVSENQIKRMFALQSRNSAVTGEKIRYMTEEELREKVREILKLEHLSDIPRTEYDRVCVWIETTVQARWTKEKTEGKK